jgi:hypothetical protein
VTFFKRSKPGEPPEYAGILQRLNQVETGLARLELDSAERQVAVLNAMEKTLTQLKARERKRESDASRQVPAESDAEVDPRTDRVAARHASVPRPEPTAHLSRRFRLGG